MLRIVSDQACIPSQAGAEPRYTSSVLTYLRYALATVCFALSVLFLGGGRGLSSSEPQSPAEATETKAPVALEDSPIDLMLKVNVRRSNT